MMLTMMFTTGVGRNFGGGSMPNQGLRKCQLASFVIYVSRIITVLCALCAAH
jgi:hypothetical protein